MSSQENITYVGNCHCGAFKFTAKLPEIKSGVTCNCSICIKKGYLCLTVQEEDSQVLRGEGTLEEYVFGVREWVHEFCKTCGTPVWVRKRGEGVGGADEFALNIRTLIGINPFELEEGKKLDALNIPPIYVPPQFEGEVPFVQGKTEDLETYTGACHCGAVTLAIKSLPLSEVEVIEDNCSICTRHANTFIYPLRTHVSVSGSEHLTSYSFNNHIAPHKFCSICGVHVLIDMQKPKPEVWDKYPEDVKGVLRDKLEMVPVRLAVLEGVEREELKVVRRMVGTEGYVVA